MPASGMDRRHRTGRAPGWRLRGIGAMAALAGALACAVSVPPSGGPEDKTPPTVSYSVPRADSTGVDPSSPIRIGFSEPMTRARLERQVTVSPAIRIRKAGWENGALVIEPEGGLARDTTYVVRVKPGYRDEHGVPSTAGFEFAFATGAAIDTARIEGVVYLRREPSKKAIVRCFRLPAADTLDLYTARPDREAATGPDGRFALRYLPNNDARFRVMAFVDQNGNGSYERDSDPVVVLPDTVALTPAVPVVTGLALTAVDPAEPGSVRGVVVNESGADSARVMAGLFAEADSARALYLAVCDSAGGYEFRQVKPGEYALRAFVDLAGDSVAGSWPCPGGGTPGCPEPAARLETAVVVKPGQSVEAPPIVIRRREEP